MTKESYERYLEMIIEPYISNWYEFDKLTDVPYDMEYFADFYGDVLKQDLIHKFYQHPKVQHILS